MSKNESVPGIYSSRTGVGNAVSVWETPAFRIQTRTRLCFFDKIQVPRNWRQRKGREHPKGQLRAQARKQRLVARWGGWLARAHSPRGLGPFIATEPIVSALAEARADGAVGGVTETLVGLGIP